MTDYKEVRTTEHEAGREQRVATFKATQLIWLLLGLLEAAIALRVIFKLLGVNEANSFATLLYSITGFFLAPFASLAKAPAAGGSVLEVSSIIAMIVYLLIGWALERIVYVLILPPAWTGERQTNNNCRAYSSANNRRDTSNDRYRA